MSAPQLSFALRTSSSVKTVHLVGSWDSYHSQLPLRESGRSGSWSGTFRFPSTTLRAGQRYWYYYIVDGCRAFHDPSKPSVTEATTRRELNILDVSSYAGGSASHPGPDYRSSTASRRPRHDEYHYDTMAHGRSLSPSNIQSPYPQKPYATRDIVANNYARSNRSAYVPVDALTQRLAAVSVSSRAGRSPDRSDGSDIDSDVPSLGSYSSRSGGSSPGAVFSSGGSSPSSRSSDSGGGRYCTCERYGITRRGDRVKLDCRGARCGSNFSSDGSPCSSDSEDDPAPRRKPASYVSSSRNYATREMQPRSGYTRSSRR